jgi:hypothetical protein
LETFIYIDHTFGEVECSCSEGKTIEKEEQKIIATVKNVSSRIGLLQYRSKPQLRMEIKKTVIE